MPMLHTLRVGTPILKTDCIKMWRHGYQAAKSPFFKENVLLEAAEQSGNKNIKIKIIKRLGFALQMVKTLLIKINFAHVCWQIRNVWQDCYENLSDSSLSPQETIFKIQLLFSHFRYLQSYIFKTWGFFYSELFYFWVYPSGHSIIVSRYLQSLQAGHSSYSSCCAIIKVIRKPL